MGIDINFLDMFCAAAMQEGRQLLEQSGPVRYTSSALPGGGHILRAKMVDSFNFVDHPQIELDPTGRQILQFGCDCPDYRRDKSFCAHCAALALLLQAKKTICFSEEDAQDAVVDGQQPGTEARIADELAADVMDFTYKYANSSADLYPGIDEPKIGLDIFKRAFHKARAIEYFEKQKAWNGNCFGMVASASMMQQRNENTTVPDFNENAQRPVELALTDYNTAEDLTVLQFIELVHILQRTQVVQRCITQDEVCDRPLKELVALVKDFQRGEGQPVMMAVLKKRGGHAILPFRVEEVSSTEDKLYIYDPNRPETTCYASLKKDAHGNYWSWRFPVFGDVSYSNELGSVNVVPYAAFKAAWDNRHGKNRTLSLHVNADVALFDEVGTILARVTADGVESYREDIRQVFTFDGDDSGEIQLLVPAGCYTVRLEDLNQNELFVHLIGDDLTVKVATTAREIVVHVDDDLMIADAQIGESDSSYNISILNTFGEEPEHVTLEGVTGTQRLHLAQREGQLYQSGLTDVAALRVNGKLQALRYIRSLEELEAQREQEQELILNASKTCKEDPEQP